MAVKVPATSLPFHSYITQHHPEALGDYFGAFKDVLQIKNFWEYWSFVLVL